VTPKKRPWQRADNFKNRTLKFIAPGLASHFLHGEESTMLNRAAKIAILVLIPLSAFAAQKGKETSIQVVSSKTKIHNSSSGSLFTYTNLLFTEVNGKRIVYECVQRGDICPLLESGKTYTADLEGAYISFPMSTPEDNRVFPVKFRQVGTW
jgi:hypothetical protein